LEHFFAVASQVMPAFLQAASVLGIVPAKAGAATATIRLKAIIDTKVFINVSCDADCTTIPSTEKVALELPPNVTRRFAAASLCRRALCRPEAMISLVQTVFQFSQTHLKGVGFGRRSLYRIAGWPVAPHVYYLELIL
jgi:hypothetical protein